MFSDGRRKPFFVRYGRPRHVESFASEFERNDRAVILRREWEEYEEPELVRFNPREWEEFKAWKAQRQLAVRRSVEQAVEQYLAARDEEGLSPDSISHARLHLTRFAEKFGALNLSEINMNYVKLWLGKLRSENRFSDVTVAHHRISLSSLFSWAVRMKLVNENPCAAIPAPRRVRSDDVAVLTLREAFRFFSTNRDQPAIGRLALEAFGGLRYSSAARLTCEELDFENKGITFPSTKHKLGKRFYVDGWPHNLWRWVGYVPRGGWGLPEWAYARGKKDAFIRAGVSNAGNVFRHTFATMHLAAFNKQEALARLLTHRDVGMLMTHYRGRGVPQAVARAYFCITPRTVELGWERFCEWFHVPKSAR